MASDRCEHCGANLALVGRMHRCIGTLAGAQPLASAPKPEPMPASKPIEPAEPVTEKPPVTVTKKPKPVTEKPVTQIPDLSLQPKPELSLRPKRRGRPSTGQAMSSAERVRRFRERRRQAAPAPAV
jgi:outer membrane biosynthesis protein TonB